jgi:hypothetical protein
MTLTIIQNDGGTRQLMVKEKSGAQRMYDLNDPEARNKLPPPIAEKLKQMESKLKPDDKPKTDKPGSNHKPQPGADVNVEKRIESHGDADDESDEETETEVEVREGNRPSARAPISDNDVLNISLNELHGPGIQTVKLARVRDGQVRVPFIEPVPCAGLTVRELEKRIRTRYVESKIAPTVNVRVRKVTGASELAADAAKTP